MPRKQPVTFSTSDFETGDIVVSRMQNRRGNRVNLPQPLEPGELGWCLDTQQLFIGLTEEDATAAVEIYRGNIVNAESIVQSLLDQQIIEFDTYWTRVNNNVSLIQDISNVVSEQSLLADLRAIPSAVFVDAQKRPLVNEIEENITLINQLNAEVKKSLNSVYASPSDDYDFSDQAAITYDWEISAPVSLQLRVKGVGANGEITSIEIINSGLGYLNSQTVLSDATTANGATFSVSYDTNNQGIATSVQVATPGTNYIDDSVISLTPPSLDSIQAKASVTNVINGMVATIQVDDGGQYYKAPPEITIYDASGIGATAEATITNGVVTLITVTSGGIDYVNPTVSIAPPLSDNIYKFKYDVGVDNQAGLDFSVPGTVVPQTPEDFTRLANSITYLSNDSNIENVGVVGLSPSEISPEIYNGYNNEMVNGTLLLSTARQSTNVSSLLNSLSTTADGLVNSKQNVEIITEASSLGNLPDLLYLSPITYELVPSEEFTPVLSETLLGNSSPLEYTVEESDTQRFEYTTNLSEQEYSSSGEMCVITNPAITVGNQSQLSNSSTEVRGFIPSLNDGGPDIVFKSVYNVDRGVVEVHYKHDFPGTVILKLITRRWKSF